MVRLDPILQIENVAVAFVVATGTGVAENVHLVNREVGVSIRAQMEGDLMEVELLEVD
jgi:hypothetical protein